MDNSLNVLSSRAGFNTALRHFKCVTGYISDISDGENLAELINESLQEGEIERYQVKVIVGAILLDKLGYQVRSHNLLQNIEDADHVVKAVADWGKLHIVFTYFHPQAGMYVINPKNVRHWESVLPLVQDELAVIYAGPAEGPLKAKTLNSALDDFIKILYGSNIKTKKEYQGTRKKPPAPAPQPEPAAAEAESPQPQPVMRRVTPRYSVQVTNELFHNGNVEAWKKIVESYKAAYPGLDVLIWYENERINDINALFKWGKVKHGGLIFFSIAGENVRDVSKLQRYLFEGASPRFEVFLRAGVGEVLDLF
jgi:hypothetical protein